MKVTRIILVSDPNPIYCDFWNPISKVYREKFGIETSLVWLGTRDQLYRAGIEDTDVIFCTHHPDYPVPFQTALAMFYFTKAFPDDTLLTQGIDEVHLSPMFIRYSIAGYDDDSYVQMIADAYKPNYWRNHGGVSPSGQHVAKGSTFQKVFNFPDTFNAFVEQVVNSGIPAFWEDTAGRWGLDESYVSHVLRESQGVEMISCTDFRLFCDRRIECERSKETPYDIEKLNAGWYSQAHLCRPYANHKEYLDKLFNDIPVWK